MASLTKIAKKITGAHGSGPERPSKARWVNRTRRRDLHHQKARCTIYIPFAALIITSAVVSTPAQAQTASARNSWKASISGTVEKLNGDLVALSLSRGISLVVRLGAEAPVNSVAKGSGSDLKAGSQVSIQAKSGQSGDLIATQIVLYAPGSNSPDAEPGPDDAQLVSIIKDINAPPEGPVLTVADKKDGDRKITIGPDTTIWIARAAHITDIKVGSAVTMTGVKREDGSLQVLRATIGPAGAGNPPL
jgi:hypothetical protein